MIFRACEFFIGVLLADLKLGSRVKKILCNWWTFAIEFFIMAIGVTLAIKITGMYDYMLLSFCSLPCFILMIISLANIKYTKFLETKLTDYACKISYMFFLAQFYTWIVIRFLGNYCGITGNIAKISLSFIICVIISILLYNYVELPSKNLAKKLIYK